MGGENTQDLSMILTNNFSFPQALRELFFRIRGKFVHTAAINITATQVRIGKRGSKNTDSKDFTISQIVKQELEIHDDFLLFCLQTTYLSFLLVYKLIRSKTAQLCQLRLQLQFPRL